MPELPAPLRTIALRRLSAVATGPHDETADEATSAAYTAELARLGIRLDRQAVTTTQVGRLAELRDDIAAWRGLDDVPAPLFANFPDGLPAIDDVGLRTLAVLATMVASGVDVSELSADEIVTAAETDGVGWWQASSVPQDIAAAEVAKDHQRLLARDTPRLLTLTALDDDETGAALARWLTDMLHTSAGLGPEIAADLGTLLDHFGDDTVDVSSLASSEARALVLARWWSRAVAGEPAAHDALAGSGAAPDDLLRLFAGLTGTDTSLRGQVTVPKLSRPARRLLVDLLEASERRRDVFRHRGLWLAVDRALHLGEHRRRCPQTAATFDELRSVKHDTHTPTSRAERALAAGSVSAAAGALSAGAPAVLLRSLRRYAALNDQAGGSADALCDAVATASRRATLRLLLTARGQLADNGRTYPRVAVNVAGRATAIDHEPGHLAASDAQVAALLDVLDTAIASACAARAVFAGRRVHLDPAAETLLLPDSPRAADGLVTAARGSRIPLGADPGDTLRLFTYWREAGETSDLDLSLVAFDELLRPAGQVSWTGLAHGAIVHSGDLTSAPAGAAEFIDVPLDEPARHGWRYLAPVVYRYSGPRFDELAAARTGWMLRSRTGQDTATFDAATVLDAVRLSGPARSLVPVVYDVATGELVVCQLQRGGRAGAATETDDGLAQVLSAMLTRQAFVPSIAELVRVHVTHGGGTLTCSPQDAEVTIGVGPDSDYPLLQPARIVAELL